MKTTRKLTAWLLTLALALVLAPAMAGNAKAAADYHIVWAAGTSDGDSPRIGYVGNDTNQPISFTAWNGVPTSSGNYYLTGDVELNEEWMITKNVTINLCLNGHSIISKIDNETSAVIRLQFTSATLNLYDVSGDNGKITHYYDAGISQRYKGHGVVVYGTLNMYGGSIADNDGIGSPSQIFGAGVHLFGTFNLYAGSITGNKASKGGGIYLAASGVSKFNMYGGSITNNTALVGGGGVFVENQVGAVSRMAGGTISGNTVNSSPNDVDVQGSGTFIYSGGTVGNVTGTETTGVTITFNANGGSGTMPPQIVEQSNSGTVTLNGNGGFSRVGYDFAGWLANAGDTDTITTVVPSSSNTVYAKWTPINYTISYTLNGGSVASANPTSYNIKTSTFNLNNPTRDYYNFTGWTGTGLSGEVTNVTVEMGSTGDRSYTATWTPISYAITYNLAGGSVTPANPTSYTYETAAFTLNNPTRDGYRFTGWTGTDLTAASTSVTIPTNSYGDRSYTAAWAQLYGVTVENGTADATDAAENDVVTITADAAPAGKLFDKWTSADGVVFVDENAETTTFSMPAQAVTVTANYKNVPTPPAPAPAPSVPSYYPDPTPPTYPPSVADAQNGTVTVSPKNPQAGDKVTITVTPDTGYQVESVTVTDAFGKNVTVKDNGDGTYAFTQPSGKVTIKVTFAPISAPTLTTAELLTRFSDLQPGAWYLEPVRYMVERGIMNGTDKGFEPNAATTQGMMEQILYNLDGNELVAPAEGGAWWNAADNWAGNGGVTDGVAAHDPSANATREQDVVMMFNYARSKGYDTGVRADLSRFSDADGVSDWAREAMAWAVAVGIINGTVDQDGNIILDAQGTATRAQVAAIVQRFCENVVK